LGQIFIVKELREKMKSKLVDIVNIKKAIQDNNFKLIVIDNEVYLEDRMTKEIVFLGESESVDDVR
jgi:hypothetical protein